MAEQSIDKLSIEISANTQKAIKNIDSLSTSLNKLGSTLSKNINSTKLESVATAFKSLSESTRQFGKSTKAIENLPKLTQGLSQMASTLSGASISTELLQLADSLSKIQNVGGALKTVTSATNSMPKAVEKTAEKTAELKQKTEEVVESNKKLAKSQTQVARTSIDFSAIGKGLKAVPGRIGQVNKMVQKFKDKYFGISNILKKDFKEQMTNLLKYYFGIRSLFVLTNRLRSAIEDGTKNLVKYSAEYNNTISTILSGVGTVKNAMAVSFAPIINYLQGAINKLLDSIISAFNTLARLFAKFTGAKQVVQATRYYEDYAESLGNASASAKDLTTGIDELNILSDSSGGGGGSAFADPSEMFKTIAVDDEFSNLQNSLKDALTSGDFTEIGTIVADKINGALQNIDWNKIKGKSGKLGKGFATFLNGVFEESLNGQSFGTTLGNTIGEAVNTAIEFGFGFVQNFHYDSYGRFLRDGLNGIFLTVKWEKLGQTLGKHVSGLLEVIHEIVSDKSFWTNLGNAIKEFLLGGIDTVTWDKLGEDLSDLASGLCTSIKTALGDPALWQDVGQAIADFISGIKWKQVVFDLTDMSVSVTDALAEGLYKAIKEKLGISDSPVVKAIEEVFGENSFFGRVLKNAFESILPKSIQRVLDFRDSFKELQGESDTTAQVMTNTGNSITNNLGTAIENAKSKVREFASNINEKWNLIKTDTAIIWSNIKVDLYTKWNEIKLNATLTFNNLKSTISNKWSEIKSDTATKWNNIKSTLITTWTNIKNQGTTMFDQFKTNVVNSFNNIKNGIKSPINAIIGFVESMVNRLADGFNQVARDLENLLSVDWTNPVTGTHYHAGLSLPRAGHVSLARLEDGGFVPNTNMGTLFWAGENGAEIVSHASNGTEVMNASQVGSAVSEGVRSAIVQAVTPYLTQIMSDTRDLANKDFATYIGDREIARANARGSKLNGMTLINI